MNPSEFYFCVHDGDNNYHEDPDWMIITFCPAAYWDERKCLPDYYFAEQLIKYIPQEYRAYICLEEAAWCSQKSKEEIRRDLSTLGFVESIEMEEFLTGCWS